MRWIRLYQGQGPTDAHILSDFLEQKGIALQLRGTGLAGLGGAISRRPKVSPCAVAPLSVTQ